MARKTTTLKLPLSHLYHLTHDSNNNTGYTIEEVTSMMHELGSSHVIEATIDHPIPDPQPEEAPVEESAPDEPAPPDPDPV